MPQFLTNINLNKNELQNARVQNLGSAPGTPVAGQIYYDTGTNTIQLWNGTTWATLSTGSVADATTGSKGIVQLAGDLGGTATSPTVPALTTKANLASPTFTGTPAAPTAAVDTNTTQIATTAYVVGQGYAKLASPTFTGTVTLSAGTLALGTSTISGTPTFSGAATGLTATVDTNTTQLATTAFVIGQAAAASPLMDSAAAVGTSTRFARADHVHPSDTSRSPVAGSASITTVGTITSGVWNGTALTSSFVPNLSGIAIPTASVNLNSQKITNLLDPSAAQDAATKNYVDNTVTGLDAKTSVRVATVGTETFTVAAGAVTTINGTTIDGISISIGDRILVKDAPATSGVGSSNSSQPGNGIYVVTGNTTNLSISRAGDMDTWAEVPSSYTWVEVGTANGDTGWVATSDQGGTLNTTAITWSQFAASTTILAGNGLTKSGNTISVLLNGGAASGLSIAAGGINISAAGVTNAMLAGSIDLTTKVTGALPIGNGGTGQTTAKTARETGLSAAGYFTVTGSGTATTFTVTQASHGLRASRFLVGQCQIAATGEVVNVDITVASSGDVTFTFAASQTLSTYQFTIIG